MQRHGLRLRFLHILHHISVRHIHRIRLRRQRQIHRRLRQRQVSLRRTQKIKRLFRRQRHRQRPWLRQSNILARHPHHAPRQIQRILAALNHPRQPI